MNKSIRIPNPADILLFIHRKLDDIIGTNHYDKKSKAAIILKSPPSTINDTDKAALSAFMTTATSTPSPHHFVTREELGRSTWIFLHTLAAQYPETPSRQNQKDVNNLFDILTRLYPCGHCAKHFKQVIKHSPPRASNRKEFQHWLCSIHNIVNRRLGKEVFDCNLVEERWGGVECDGDGEQGCAMDWGNSSTAIKKKR
jgi:mitochondrial FAD-linked sulfhydryl oxidase